MLQHRLAGVLMLLLIAPFGRGMAEAPGPATLPAHPARPRPTTIDAAAMHGAQERITVWGHRKHFFPAPMADKRAVAPRDQPGFGPGSRLGIATVEGGRASDHLRNGVSAGIAIPIAAGVPGLDFTVTATGSRDEMAPSGTTGAASATAGLRLKL